MLVPHRQKHPKLRTLEHSTLQTTPWAACFTIPYSAKLLSGFKDLLRKVVFAIATGKSQGVCNLTEMCSRILPLQTPDSISFNSSVIFLTFAKISLKDLFLTCKAGSFQMAAKRCPAD
jgi:hypothetical protein